MHPGLGGDAGDRGENVAALSMSSAARWTTSDTTDPASITGGNGSTRTRS